MFDPGTRSEAIDCPGASRSGTFSEGAMLLYGASSSSAVDTVPLVLDAATPMTYRSLAGLARRTDELPSLPAAATTTMPAFQARCTAKLSGSLQKLGLPPLPYDRLSTRIRLAGSSLRCATTQSIAAMTCVTSTAPLEVPSFSDVSFALGAMPLVPVAVSLPTMMPAMWVPWPYVSRYRRLAD